MKNILILTGTEDPGLKAWMMADLIIEIKTDGTFLVLKNRHGSKKVGKINELLDLSTIPMNETIFETKIVKH